MGPQDPPNRPRSPEDINGPKLPGLPWEFDNFLEAWRFGVFWGSEGTLEKGSWGSKSIGYQAFYRFRCVLGVQICRIPGFLSIQMRFWGPNLQDTRLFIDSNAFWGSKSIGYQAFYRFKCVFGGPTQPISQIASAQIPLFIGFGASAPIGFLKQGAQLQDPIH